VSENVETINTNLAGEGDEAEASAEDAGRARSTIVFPYAPLSDAERVALELHKYGGTATPEGVAKVLGQKSRSGAFRQKMSSARIFGLVGTRPGQVSLTRLGKAVIDPEKQARARAEAFLNVPLYKALFDKYQGDLLPPMTTLDHEIAELGVSPKQASTARQVMFRSAEQAGFFARGSSRLVAPTAEVNAVGGRAANDASTPMAGEFVSLDSTLEAPIVAMLEVGETWSPEQTHEYVDGLRKMHRALSRD
jgi:hypothetical protein